MPPSDLPEHARFGQPRALFIDGGLGACVLGRPYDGAQ